MGTQAMWGISKDRVTSADTQASQKNALDASGITLCPGSLRGLLPKQGVRGADRGPGSQREQVGVRGGGGSRWGVEGAGGAGGGGCEAVGHEGSHIMGTS